MQRTSDKSHIWMQMKSKSTMDKIKRPVNVDGIEFESVRAAAVYLGCHPAYATTCLKKKKPCKGKEIFYVK